MNKGEFIRALAQRTGFTAKDATAAYDAFVGVVSDAIRKGDKVQLIGFGSFELKKKAARTGINPQTKKPVKIAASKAPTFKAGNSWKAIFN